MTIVSGAACREGLAIAGDSRTTVLLPGVGARSATDFAHKVCEFNHGTCIAATSGWSNIEGRNIADVVRDFDRLTPAAPDIDQAAAALCRYFQAGMQAHVAAGLDAAPPPGVEPLRFIVGGYDANGVGKIKLLLVWSGQVLDQCATNSPGGMWDGETDAVSRLLKGYDNARIDISKWASRNRQALANVEYITPFVLFALQDIIDWTTFLCRMTIDTQRFTNGTMGDPGKVPTCGGEIEVAVVTEQGVRWIRQTGLRP